MLGPSGTAGQPRTVLLARLRRNALEVPGYPQPSHSSAPMQAERPSEQRARSGGHARPQTPCALPQAPCAGHSPDTGRRTWVCVTCMACVQGEVDDVFQVAMNMPNLTTLQLSNNVGLRGPLLPANAEPITTATCALSTVSPCQHLERLHNPRQPLTSPGADGFLLGLLQR